MQVLRKSFRKLHIDFIPFERFDIRVVEVDGERKYVVSSRANYRSEDPDRWIMQVENLN